MTSLLLALALTAGPPRWTATDTAWEASYLALDLVDWQTTRALARGSDFADANPLIGRRPAPRRVDLYFATTAVLHVGIAAALPPRARHIFQAITIAFEIPCVAGNGGYMLRFQRRF